MNYNVAMIAKKRGTRARSLGAPDLLAADRVGLEVMGIPHHAVGYLQYANPAPARSKMDRIDIRGEKPEKVKRTFESHDQGQQQLDWLNEILRQS